MKNRAWEQLLFIYDDRMALHSLGEETSKQTKKKTLDLIYIRI